MTMTKKQTVPLKLWFDSADEMRCFSNKQDRLQQLFDHLNHRQLQRIDTLQLFAVILIAVPGKPEVTLRSKPNAPKVAYGCRCDDDVWVWVGLHIPQGRVLFFP